MVLIVVKAHQDARVSSGGWVDLVDVQLCDGQIVAGFGGFLRWRRRTKFSSRDQVTSATSARVGFPAPNGL